MTNVAVLGLGLMGAGIAQNLVRAGFRLAVYNRTHEKAQPLVEAGARWAATPRAAAEGAEVVVSVVADDGAARSVWLGEAGAFAALKPGAVVVECATASLEWMREWHTAARARGLRSVDAPLFGSKDAAASGQVNLYVGAEAEDFEAARPVLAAFSGNATRLGPATSGTVYKLVNNMMGAVHLAALGEAVALAEKAGLNLEAVAAAIDTGAASSPMVKGRLNNVIRREYDDVYFELQWMHKDVSYALRLAEELGVPLPTAAAVRELYRMAMQRGLGELDSSAEAEVVRGAGSPGAGSRGA
jgi:3-hydroxyisobutyrate dehydrogenase